MTLQQLRGPAAQEARTQQKRSKYPVSGVEASGAAADDADVERLGGGGGGEAPRRPQRKHRPQPPHRAGEQPQVSRHLGRSVRVL
nr:unnamed protein product [Digitaria exilis]